MRHSMMRACAFACLLLLAACGTRSISNSGYNANGYGANGLAYRGELSEFDVLGIDSAQKITEEDIQAALKEREREPLSIQPGGSILLVQSGAAFPDVAMQKSFERHYNIVGFSGVPARASNYYATSRPLPDENYALKLRLAAARGGQDKIVAYWGILETSRDGMATKAISWVPLFGLGIPDETQLMRIRLKIAVVDTRTGQWDMFTTQEHEDKAMSAIVTRASSDQEQVALLKEKAYPDAVEAFVERYKPARSTSSTPPILQ